ncbi:hypothetical protein niasHT_010065 [Heterodera trifolii]|uniref:Protein root UVB sensitive/RUS domain-containing protein n=1 Tax=Heterodera trifolii TaxID=157864 RepID=A0ABD2LYI8_9BILA
MTLDIMMRDIMRLDIMTRDILTVFSLWDIMTLDIMTRDIMTRDILTARRHGTGNFCQTGTGTSARRDNLADVAAKDGSQETLVNVLSVLCSLVLLPQVEGRPFIIWALFLLFTAVHLFGQFFLFCPCRKLKF